MPEWKLADAKNRFSEVFARVRNEGPQIVSRHGKERIVLLSEEEYRRLKSHVETLADTFSSAPKDDEIARLIRYRRPTARDRAIPFVDETLDD